MRSSRRLFILILIFSYTFIVFGTISPKTQKTKEQKAKQSNALPPGPVRSSIFDRKLVHTKIRKDEILNNYQSFYQETDAYQFTGLTLGFVTPWNNHGYDIAKIFGNKFSHISPVWLQVKKEGKVYEVTGTHDIDKEWMAHVRNAGRERKTKIVPRVIMENWSKTDILTLVSNKREEDKLIKSILKVCKRWHFDGIVLEAWNHLKENTEYPQILHFVKNLGDSLANEHLETILVVPPKRGDNFAFNNTHFDALYDHITAFSLMTYDFSNTYRPGPNSPLSWFEDCVKVLTSNTRKRAKILNGINLYGNDFANRGGGPILGTQFIDILKANSKDLLQFHHGYVEHYYEYRDKDGHDHLVFYPTIYSINARIHKAQELNTGISFWELGQGLDYFYDLF